MHYASASSPFLDFAGMTLLDRAIFASISAMSVFVLFAPLL